MPPTTAPNPSTTFDIEAEIAYWRGTFGREQLDETAFANFACLLRLGYAIIEAYPHASAEQRLTLLKNGYCATAAGSAIPWDHARWLIHHAWRHLESKTAPA